MIDCITRDYNATHYFGYRERAPISSRLNAIDFYLVMCIFLVFGALLEYGVILLLLKKRRKPQYSIDAGLQKMFNNGDAMQPLQNKREMPNSPSAQQGGCLEEAKRLVSYYSSSPKKPNFVLICQYM